MFEIILYIICRMGEDLNILSAELSNLKETERHLSELLSNERQNVETKTKALKKLENVLKAVVANNEDAKEENAQLHLDVCD